MLSHSNEMTHTYYAGAVCDGFANESSDLNAGLKIPSLVSTVSGRTCTGIAVIVLIARKALLDLLSLHGMNTGQVLLHTEGC